MVTNISNFNLNCKCFGGNTVAKITKKILLYSVMCGLSLNFANTAYAGKVYEAVSTNNWNALINAVHDDPTSVNDMDRNAFTAVMKAIEINNFPMFIFLIANGADINAKDDNGKTVLSYVISSNSYYDRSELVDALIALGADINIRDYEGENALMNAIRYRDIYLVRLLLKNWNADINVQNDCGCTSLMLAIMLHGDRWIIDFLIKNKIDISIKNDNGDNALMLAVVHSGFDIVKLIIEYKTDINIRNRMNINDKNNDGNTALILASKSGRWDLIDLLIKNGASINAQNRDGNTAVMVAAIHGRHTVIELLTKRGANLKIKNKEGLTFLDLSKKYGKSMVTISSNEPLKIQKLQVPIRIKKLQMPKLTNELVKHVKNKKPAKNTNAGESSGRGKD